ncbi:hypothetical protein LTR37_016063 [Vermiconidia calcicola]|uniref:Uncharacterized protein n=1 Tax=Vermiconidia calcicola TaxID=1690605 RepID=A0ACC3MNT2_9PEZI|nr:hypothetical protein LTR37_016063 [Vermiconidia calcicola]
MTITAGCGATSRALQEHREQMGRLLCFPDANRAFGDGVWWAYTALGDDVWFPETGDMFEITTSISLPPSSAPAPLTVTSPTTIPGGVSKAPAPSPTITSPTTIPDDVSKLADYINSLPTKKNGLPSRNKLRKDARSKGEVSRKTGCLGVEKRGSKLRKWEGDKRLFSAELWAWLVDEKEDGEKGLERKSLDLARKLQREERGLRGKGRN